MISIYGIDGSVIFEVLVTEGCKHYEELMKSDYIELSWSSADNDIIPAGSYILHNGYKYRLLGNYSPVQSDELEYKYAPQFHSEEMMWGKVPFFLYTEFTQGKIVKEPDWELTSLIGDFMNCIVKAIKNETGQTWTFRISGDIKATAFVSFNNTDILSGLNAIVDAFETEWYSDKANKILYIGRAEAGSGNRITLQVGNNIGVPSVTDNKEDYFNRFYVFGSTRNIDQSNYTGSVQSIVNRRLILDPAIYPNGYIDSKGHYENGVFVSDLTDGAIFSTSLFFDDIYPRATTGEEGSRGVKISDVRARTKFIYDEETGEKIQIGTNEDGTPIYKMFSVWYFKIPSLDFSTDMVIADTNLTCSFESGVLQGYEFELKYHDEEKTIDDATGTPFKVEKGDYEIFYITENDVIIPTNVGVSGLIPHDGDEIALFNIKLPEEYTQIAYKELESSAIKEIEKRESDFNNYTFASNPIEFENNNPNLYVGRAVTYVNGSYSYDTRVIKLVTQLDFPCEQVITIGNETIKGSISELKEEVVSANNNIDVLAALNEQTVSIQNAYKRSQDSLTQLYSRIGDMWQFDSEGHLFSPYGVYSQKFISARGKDDSASSAGMDVARMWEELAKKSEGNIIDESHIPDTIARKSDLESLKDNLNLGLKWNEVTNNG